MTCKDCIHGELCDLMCEYCEELPTCLRPSPECAFFKDKSKLIELPCQVGDKVYTVLDVERDVGEFEIYSLHYIITDHRIIRYIAECHSHDVDEIWFYDDEIGETVFLTNDEAEKALEEKERE